MTPLDHLTLRRISTERQWQARLAICRHVRGLDGHGLPAIGPRYRVGSNAPVGMTEEHLLTDAPLPPCPHCGAPGDPIISVGGEEYCPGCGETWIVGDYDWNVLADVLRYHADKAAGLIQTVTSRG